MDYDVLYYWQGGRENGLWRAAGIPISVDKQTQRDVMLDRIADIEAMGYVTNPGLRTIGPPEGPPASKRFEALGL